MRNGKVHKIRTSRLQRLWRLIAALVDPRVLAHGFKVLAYYNYTHVRELRRARVGRGGGISPTASFANGQNIVIGDRVSIGAGASLWAGPGHARVILGDDVLIAPGVMLTATNYRFNDGSPITRQAMDEADIVVGSDVWIGYGAVVLAGARIGDGAIIGAGAIVRGEVPARAIVANEPARVVGQRVDAAADGLHRSTAMAEADASVAALVRRELPRLDAATLAGPLDRAGIDSFDLVTLRTALETACGTTIPDREWAGIATLDDIAKLPSLAGGGHDAPRLHQGAQSAQVPHDAPVPIAPPGAREAPAALGAAPGSVASAPEAAATAPAPGRSQRRFGMNMPQMALSGLGEAWLFKELGDIHWAMITAFLQSPSSAIADEQGDRLYATFTRIRLDVIPSLQGFRENADLRIDSKLDRYGASFFFADHQVGAGIGPEAAQARATTMSTFAKYGERGKNTSLIKGSPTLVDPGAVPSLDAIPEFAVEYRVRRGAEAPPAIFECDYEILPPHDINGVGLLYFAAYPTVFDLCLERAEGKGFLMSHSTAGKDVCYFANSEPGETLRFRLHAREVTGDGLIRHTASLARSSDGVRMAEVTSLKRPLAPR